MFCFFVLLILFTFQTDFAFLFILFKLPNVLASCSKSQLAAAKEALRATQAFVI